MTTMATAMAMTMTHEAAAPSSVSRTDDLEMVRRIAGAMARRLPAHVEMDELVGLGNLGLVEAHRRFDARRGVPFAAFAALRVRGAMLDGLRQQDPVTREERARLRSGEAETPTLRRVDLEGDVDRADDDEPADELLERRELLAALRRALDQLSERERHVVSQHFLEERPLRGVGEELGVTESRVCQIVSGAVARLRTSLGIEHMKTRTAQKRKAR